jgi:hypothetical protein
LFFAVVLVVVLVVVVIVSAVPPAAVHNISNTQYQHYNTPFFLVIHKPAVS